MDTKGTRLLVSRPATSTETGPGAFGAKGIERRSSYLSTSPRTVKAEAVYDYSSSLSCPPREVRTVPPPPRNLPVKYRCACCKKNLGSRKEFDLVTRQFERKVMDMHHIMSKKQREKYEIAIHEINARHDKQVQNFRIRNQCSNTVIQQLKAEIRTQKVTHKRELEESRKNHRMALLHTRQIYGAQILASQRSHDYFFRDQLREMAENYSKMICEYEKEDNERVQRAQDEATAIVRNTEAKIARIRAELEIKLLVSNAAGSHLNCDINDINNFGDTYSKKTYLAITSSNNNHIAMTGVPQKPLEQQIKLLPLPAPIAECTEGEDDLPKSGVNVQENNTKTLDQGKTQLGSRMSTVTDPDRGQYKDNADFRDNSLILDNSNNSGAVPVSPDLGNIGNGDVSVLIASLSADTNNTATSFSFPLVAPNPSASLTTRGPPNEAEIEDKRGLDLINEGFYPDAHLCFEKAVRLDPLNAKAWYNFGVSHANVTKNYRDALFCFEKAIKIDPKNAESWNNKGVVLSFLGRDEEAMMSYARAVEIAPNNAKAWMNMRVIFQKHGNKKAAKESFRKSIEASLQI